MARHNNWVSPRKISGVMKWKSIVEKSSFLGATVIDLKEFPRHHRTKRICGMSAACALDARCWTNTHTVARSLSFRKACVFVCVCVCVRVGMRVCAASHPHVLSLGSVFFHVRLIEDESAMWIRIKKNRLIVGVVCTLRRRHRRRQRELI